MNQLQENILRETYNQTRKGIVLDFLDGLIQIRDAVDEKAIYHCHFLRTSPGSLPRIEPGDPVIYRVPEQDETFGVVLGVIETYQAFDEKLDRKLKRKEVINKTVLEDNVLHIKAHDGMVIECGKSTIILTKEGKIQVKGQDVLSRARGMNRIKGAGVNIN